eukprot:scaffold108786_cov29-Phaeocystis_antarctica.AAC.1
MSAPLPGPASLVATWSGLGLGLGLGSGLGLGLGLGWPPRRQTPTRRAARGLPKVGVGVRVGAQTFRGSRPLWHTVEPVPQPLHVQLEDAPQLLGRYGEIWGDMMLARYGGAAWSRECSTKRLAEEAPPCYALHPLYRATPPCRLGSGLGSRLGPGLGSGLGLGVGARRSPRAPGEW